MRRARRSGSGSWGRAADEAAHNGLHIVRKGPNLILVVLRSRCVPNHDTAPDILVKTHVFGDQWLGFLWRHVEPQAAGFKVARQTNKELRIGIGAVPDLHRPAIKVEPSTKNKIACGAARIVVKLDPDKIEDGICNRSIELLVRDLALGGSRDVEFAVGYLSETLTQLIDHDGIAYGVSTVEPKEEHKKNIPYPPLCSISKSKPSRVTSLKGRGPSILAHCSVGGPKAYQMKLAKVFADCSSLIFCVSGVSPPRDRKTFLPAA